MTECEVRAKALSDVGGRAKVGVGLMELPPECDTKPAHWHSLEEEHLYVLSGRATLHLGRRGPAPNGGSFDQTRSSSTTGISREVFPWYSL